MLYNTQGDVAMTKITRLFPEGNKKAFTLSYDDGVNQDRRLVEIFNKYNLKATFNLNSGIQSEENYWVDKDIVIKRMNKEDVIELYNGHEVAIHGLTHPSLPNITKELMVEEVLLDKKNLEEMFGYPVRGMAYPYGEYNETVLEVLRTLGVAYSRTVKNHQNFSLPLNPLEWHPTTHHDDPNLMEIAKCFVEGKFEDLSLFYLWGHSYEFDLNNNWNAIEELCKYVSNKHDIWYATNIEIIDYLDVLDRLIFSAELTCVYNPSAVSGWIEVNGTAVEIKAGETKNLMELNS